MLSKQGHIHEIADISGLQEAMNGKSNTNHVHNWSTITNRPLSTVASIDEAVDMKHEHVNREIIDRLEDASGTLVYNGQALGAVFYLSVETIEDRDLIPYSQRNEGLMVLVRDDGGMYYLKGGVDNAFWTIFATGAGGATTASTLSINPTGGLTGTNVQTAVDELEVNKLNIRDAYTRAEMDMKMSTIEIDYSTLKNLPNLSLLHGHDNKETIDLFSQFRGELTWNGRTFGNMIADIYDMDKDGLIDKAATLDGLTASVPELNFVKGATSNIQQQINAMSSGAVFKGTYATWALMEANHGVPQKSDWVFIEADETRAGAYTQYYHDGESWVFGGGALKTSEASATTVGSIALGGDLENIDGTALSPQLSLTGVTGGLYKNPTIVVDEKGRVTHAEEGQGTAINDAIVSEDETWSSSKINEVSMMKSDRSHTHPQLHDPNIIGDIALNTATKEDKYVITYNAQKAEAEWQKSQGGKVLVGSKYIEGDYKIVGGSYINLFIDETEKTITINSTFRDGVANGVPTLTEITDTILVPAGQTIRVSKEAAFNKYMLNVIRMTNSEGNMMDISIYEQEEGGEFEYLSNKSTKVHDILSLPIKDMDNTKRIHIQLTNYGASDTYASFKIKTTNLM